MRTLSIVACASALLVTLMPAPVVALDDQRIHPTLMVSRDSDGALTTESRKAMRRLSAIARRNGHVRIWVTMNTPFNPFLSQQSEELASLQQERVDGLFDDVLHPLLKDGLVDYPTGVRVYAGPSVLLEVNTRGLARLARDVRVGQIVGHRE